MLQHSNAYFDKCPGSPVVYLGYSLGGIIVGNMACGGAGSRGIAANNPQVLGMIVSHDSIPFLIDNINLYFM